MLLPRTLELLVAPLDVMLQSCGGACGELFAFDSSNAGAGVDDFLNLAGGGVLGGFACIVALELVTASTSARRWSKCRPSGGAL